MNLLISFPFYVFFPNFLVLKPYNLEKIFAIFDASAQIFDNFDHTV